MEDLDDKIANMLAQVSAASKPKRGGKRRSSAPPTSSNLASQMEAHKRVLTSTSEEADSAATTVSETFVEESSSHSSIASEKHSIHAVPHSKAKHSKEVKNATASESVEISVQELVPPAPPAAVVSDSKEPAVQIESHESHGLLADVADSVMHSALADSVLHYFDSSEMQQNEGEGNEVGGKCSGTDSATAVTTTETDTGADTILEQGLVIMDTETETETQIETPQKTKLKSPTKNDNNDNNDMGGSPMGRNRPRAATMSHMPRASPLLRVSSGPNLIDRLDSELVSYNTTFSHRHISPSKSPTTQETVQPVPVIPMMGFSSQGMESKAHNNVYELNTVSEFDFVQVSLSLRLNI